MRIGPSFPLLLRVSGSLPATLLLFFFSYYIDLSSCIVLFIFLIKKNEKEMFCLVGNPVVQYQKPRHSFTAPQKKQTKKRKKKVILSKYASLRHTYHILTLSQLHWQLFSQTRLMRSHSSITDNLVYLLRVKTF